MGIEREKMSLEREKGSFVKKILKLTFWQSSLYCTYIFINKM